MVEDKFKNSRAGSSLMGLDELDSFTSEKEFTRCGLCENNCALTVTIFPDGSKFVTGNRCERGAEKVTKIKFDRSNAKKISLITNTRNSSNSKPYQNVTQFMAQLVFHVC